MESGRAPLRRCDSCGAQLPDGARVCAACGEPAGPAERRFATLLFVDLSGYTALSETLDPEELHFLLRPVMTALRRIVESYGGVVPQVHGDGFMATFGVPVAHEDDAVRAVRAALDAVDHVRELNRASGRIRIPEVHAGVECGEVLVAASRELSGFSVTGSRVNLAARLCAEAQGGQVLVGPEAHRLSRDSVGYAGREARRVRGFVDPVPVHQARVSAPAAEPTTSEPVFVGRVGQRRALSELLAAVRRDVSTRMVVVAGEAGIGTSRLLRAIVADSSGAQVLVGRCPRYPPDLPFGGLVAALRAAADLPPGSSAPEAVAAAARLAELAGVHTRAARRLLGALFGAPAERPSAGGAAEEVIRALRAIVEGVAAARGPTIVALDDIGYADPGLLTLLDDVAGRPGQAPVLWVLAGRGDVAAPPAAERVAVFPLPAEQLHALVESMVGGPVRPDVVDQLTRRASGNTLLLVESMRSLLEAGAFESGPDGAVFRSGVELSAVPTTMRGFLAARLDGLPAAELALLRDAAVTGVLTWDDYLRRFADEPLPQLLALEQRGMLRRRPASSVPGCLEYEFVQPMLRDVAYEQLPRRDRAARHLAAAAWLRDIEVEHRGWPAPDAELAHHYEQAWALTRSASGVWSQERNTARLAVAYLVRLGAGLLAVHPRSAEQALRRAQAVTDALSDADVGVGGQYVPPVLRAELHLCRARVLTDLERRAEAVTAAEQAMAAALAVGSERLLADVELTRGTLHSRLDEVPVGRSLLTSSRGRFRALGDVGGEARAVHSLAYTWRYADHLHMIELLVEANELFGRAGDAAGRGEVVTELAYILTLRGGPEFEHWLAESSRLVAAESDLRGRAGLARTEGFAALYAGWPRRALTAMGTAQGAARESGLRWVEIDALQVRAMALVTLGRRTEAEEVLAGLLATAHELRWPRLEAVATAAGALPALLAGAPELAAQRLTAAAEIFGRLAAVLDMTDVARARADVALHQGSPSPAELRRSLFGAGLVLAAARGDLFGVPLLTAPARLELLYDGGGAVGALAEALTTATRAGAGGHGLTVALCLAQARLLAGQPADDDPVDSPETPEQEALRLELAALRQLADHDPAAAAEALEAAVRHWQQLGASVWQARSLAWLAVCQRRAGDGPGRADRSGAEADRLLTRLRSGLDVKRLQRPLLSAEILAAAGRGRLR